MEFLDALAGAFADIREGIRLSPLWWRLGVDQTIAKYRRTILGPFWLASSTIATGFALSVVFGAIFGGDWRSNFTYIFSGVLTFGLSGAMITEGVGTFLGASHNMQVRNLPLSFHSFLAYDKALINFAHQVVAFWFLTICFRLFPVPHWELIFTLPLVLAVGFFLSFPLGFISTRYRDVGNFIGFILTAMFMLTPVFWRRSQIPAKLQWIVTYNPLAHMMEVLRQPFLGHPAPMGDLIAVFILLGGAVVLAIFSLAFFRRRVVFWL
jgi:ABC-type polysaccharide/polyol phosphate export permease